MELQFYRQPKIVSFPHQLITFTPHTWSYQKLKSTQVLMYMYVTVPSFWVPWQKILRLVRREQSDEFRSWRETNSEKQLRKLLLLLLLSPPLIRPQNEFSLDPNTSFLFCRNHILRCVISTNQNIHRAIDRPK